jgi:hypothetical protein
MGKLKILHTFTGPADGANPVAGVLLEGTTLYSAASLGGSFGDGTLFTLSTKGAGFEVLHDFDGTDQSANPLSTPILAASSALLGTVEPQQVLGPITPNVAWAAGIIYSAPRIRRHAPIDGRYYA